VTDSPP